MVQRVAAVLAPHNLCGSHWLNEGGVKIGTDGDRGGYRKLARDSVAVDHKRLDGESKLWRARGMGYCSHGLAPVNADELGGAIDNHLRCVIAVELEAARVPALASSNIRRREAVVPAKPVPVIDVFL